ncbi:MAG: glucose-6-phosphate dehydrogenase, partial [Actinomycetota bacterium]|nr:glucose-6-phosphate dehydrogenase [Actinomycetota bacterium]
MTAEDRPEQVDPSGASAGTLEPAAQQLETDGDTLENPLIEGLERLPVHLTALVVFGATGDLAHRKLLPALYNLAHEGALPERFELIGVSRRDQEHEDFQHLAKESIER